jgi:hypothetical protein
MAQVSSLMADLHRSMDALTGRVVTIEVVLTNYGATAGHFDQMEEILGQYVSRPASPSSDTRDDQWEVVATGSGVRSPIVCRAPVLSLTGRRSRGNDTADCGCAVRCWQRKGVTCA